MLSLSDHSDIVTLGELKEGAEEEVEAATREELYLGTSCSSHYTFTTTETGRIERSANCTHTHLSLISSPQAFFLCLSRFVVEFMETSTDSGELELPSERPAHWLPISPRWSDLDWVKSDVMLAN